MPFLGTISADGGSSRRRQPWKIAVPAKSKAQQKAAGAALAANRGDRPKSKLQGGSKEMVDR
jgi:hypothetical protein